MRYLLIFFAVLVICAFANVPAQARMLPSYSEESYVFLATDIVEATIGDRTTIKNSTTVEATVNKVYKGAHKEADTLTLADLDIYRTVDDPKDINSRKLAKGDKVLLFLVVAHSGVVPDAPEGQNIYLLIGGGLYTIKPDGIHASYQWGNPGPYEDRGEIKMTPAEFRVHLTKEVIEIDQLQADLKTKTLPADIDRFTAELKKRNNPIFGYAGDAISPAIAKRISDTRDPALIVKAAVASEGSEYQPLIKGLNFPEGREYAIIQIADPRVALSTRLLLTRALRTIGIYYNYFSDPMPPNLTAADVSNNHHLITHLAEIARQPGAPLELIECVLENLWKSYVPIDPSHPFEDRDNALKILRLIHDQPATAETIKFYIEAFTLRADRDAYRQLHSPCGDLPTLVTLNFLLRTPQVPPVQPGTIYLNIQYETGGDSPRNPDTYTLTATNINTGKQYVLNANYNGCVVLPPEVPAGSYKIQYGNGYGFTLSIR